MKSYFPFMLAGVLSVLAGSLLFDLTKLTALAGSLWALGALSLFTSLMMAVTKETEGKGK